MGERERNAYLHANTPTNEYTQTHLQRRVSSLSEELTLRAAANEVAPASPMHVLPVNAWPAVSTGTAHTE